MTTNEEKLANPCSTDNNNASTKNETLDQNKSTGRQKANERQRRWKRRNKKKKKEDVEKIWREKWEELKKEVKCKGDGRLEKEMYYRIGEILINFKDGRKEVSEHRRKIAMKIYLKYKDNKEFDDGISNREIIKRTLVD